MKMIVTIDDLMRKGKWIEFCIIRGLDETDRAYTQYQADLYEEFELTSEEALKLGFLKVGETVWFSQ